MNGPEHYREAGELLHYIAEGSLRDGAPLTDAEEATLAARAQAHATLALTAIHARLAVVAYTGSTAEDRNWCDAMAPVRRPTP